jgi:hypothetical protein
MVLTVPSIHRTQHNKYQLMKNWDEPKEERKARKAREKAGPPVVPAPPPKVETTAPPKNYVVCLKWGNKYSAEYVNKLYSMVKRNTSIDYEFVCFTENSLGIDPHITVRPLPVMSVTGWWYKPWFLSNETGLVGTALFLDLDLIVFENIDQLFSYEPNADFVIIRDFNRIGRKHWDKMNSSVFRVKLGKYNQLYQDFKINHTTLTKRFPGDQDWMYKNIKNHKFWPDEWIQSYKWEMRGRDTLGVINGQRNFKSPGNPTINPKTSIARCVSRQAGYP